MISPDQSHAAANRSRQLSAYEEACTTHDMAGGPVSSGAARPDTLLQNLAEQNFCPNTAALEKDGTHPAGGSTDRDVILPLSFVAQ